MARTETVTALFTDLVGSTELANQLGHDSYEALRHSHFHALRAAIARHNGIEIKTTGDGLMVCFASAADAVACAVSMQRAILHAPRDQKRLKIRIGASSGEASREDGDLYGPPVVEAARLCAAASAGQILVAEVLRTLVRGRGHKFTSVGELTLKGLDGALSAYEVGWEPTQPASAIPLPPKVGAAAALGLFGRAAEQGTIARCWEAAKLGGRQVVLLSGEPGIGKTRLAMEAARTAYGEGAVVMFGSCDEDINLPYGPFVEALRHFVARASDDVLAAHVGEHKGELARMVPDLAHRIPGLPGPQAAEAETERYLMFEAVTGILAAASERDPVMLVLDDLQWAGVPELLLLKHIVRSSIPMRLMIVVTYRDAELSRTHPLTSLLGDLRRETGIERIALRGLDDEGVMAFITAAAATSLDTAGIALAYAIHRETEGSPLFIGEILRNLLESALVFRDGERWAYRGDITSLGIPQGVKEAIGRRLSRLSESANKALSLASVIGREFDLALLARLAETPEDSILDAIDDAKAAALVAEVAGQTDHYAFTHALIRATLYDELSASRRARLHRRVGEALEELTGGARGDRVGELAHHWLSATKVTDSAKAIGYARQAAEKALAGLAFEEAAQYYDQALSALEPHDRDSDLLRCDLLTALGDAQRRAGSSSYREPIAKAVELARRTDDAQRFALAALGNGRTGGIFANATLIDQGLIALYEDALKALGHADSILRARLLGQLALELIFTPQRDRRHELSREAVEIARRLGDEAALFQALNARAWAITDPMTLAERLELTGELDTLANKLQAAEMRLLAALHRSGALLESGDVSGAERMIAQIEATAEELREPVHAWVAKYSRATISIMRGAPDAEQRSLAAFQTATGAWQPEAGSVLSAHLAQIRRDQGRVGELTHALRATADGQPHIAAWRASLAFLYCDTDQPELARKEMDVLAATGFTIPLNWTGASPMSTLPSVCVDLHDRQAAALLYPQVKQVAGQVGIIGSNILCYGSFAYPCGVLASCLEYWDEAERYFQQALAMNEKIGARTWIVRTRRAYAAMLLERNHPGDSGRGNEFLASALAEAEQLGMQREIVRLNRLRAGAR